MHVDFSGEACGWLIAEQVKLDGQGGIAPHHRVQVIDIIGSVGCAPMDANDMDDSWRAHRRFMERSEAVSYGKSRGTSIRLKLSRVIDLK